MTWFLGRRTVATTNTLFLVASSLRNLTSLTKVARASLVPNARVAIELRDIGYDCNSGPAPFHF